MTINKSQLLVLLLVVFLLPTAVLADNCCSSVKTVGTGSGGFVTLSCESGPDVKEESCKYENISNGSISRTFYKDTVCDGEKKVCAVRKVEIDSNANRTQLKPINFSFNVPLPGLPSEFVVDTTALPTYITWLYKFVFAVAGLLAVFMITLGGIIWIFAGGNSSKVAQAKEYIVGAVTGLLFAIFSYSILYIINPALIMNSMPSIGTVERVELEGDTNEVISGNWSPPKGIVCPKSGGSSKIKEIVYSFKGKTTYRMGGKGQPPPYPSDSKSCEGGRMCKTFCPSNSTCLDCSGFVNRVLACANLSSVGGGTSNLFNGAEKINSITETRVNNKDLKPGDLLGWMAGDDGNKVGHVYIYIGDGELADSHGGDGRKPNKAIGVYKVSAKSKTLKYIRRVK